MWFLPSWSPRSDGGGEETNKGLKQNNRPVLGGMTSEEVAFQLRSKEAEELGL